jgi:hypothetical protein
MPVSVESRNPESAVRDAGEDDQPAVAVEPSGELNGANDVVQYRPSTNPNSHLVVQEKLHLPSPSPTPSPRSSSPSLVISDSSVELKDTPMVVPNGRKYSGSHENPVFPVMTLEENGNGMLPQPLRVSKTLQPNDLHNTLEKTRKPGLLIPKLNGDDKVFKLTAAQMEELTSAPESLPMSTTRSPVLPVSGRPPLAPSPLVERKSHYRPDGDHRDANITEPLRISTGVNMDRRPIDESISMSGINRRPGFPRGVSTPQIARNRMTSYTKGSPSQTSPKRKSGLSRSRLEPLDFGQSKSATSAGMPSSFDPPPSPTAQSLPLPPMSIPTYLQLELSSTRPSPLYIYRSSTSDTIYESSRIKFERLLNFLLLPPHLEHVLYFGTLACLDAWLYTFTILPLRFLKAAAILIRWWGQTLDKEIRFITGFIYHGSGRMWHRQRGRLGSNDSPSRSRSVSQGARRQSNSTPSYHPQSARTPDTSNRSIANDHMKPEPDRKLKQGWGRRHRRVKSQPSSLSSNHKADLLQGAVIICSCMILMKLDASRMYHSIRGQAVIKLYVIYNVLEVSYADSRLRRLLSHVRFATNFLLPLDRIFLNASSPMRH